MKRSQSAHASVLITCDSPTTARAASIESATIESTSSSTASPTCRLSTRSSKKRGRGAAENVANIHAPRA
eukprot:282582-Pleurochrysis_carterae.AAC.1